MKYLGLLAALALCLIAAPASAMVIKDIDFETSGNLMRPGSPTVGFSLGAVSGQNGWTGAGTIVSGQALWAPGTGVKEVTGYGPTWWTEGKYNYNDGFPYGMTPSVGRIATCEYDVTITQQMIDDANPVATVNLSYGRFYWVDEVWEYHVSDGYTKIMGGANLEHRAYLKADGSVNLWIKRTYNSKLLNANYYIKTNASGSWDGTAGTYHIKIALDGSGASAVSTLYVNGGQEVQITHLGPVCSGLRFKQITTLTGLYKPEYDNVLITQVPEPATMLLLGGGLLFGGLAYRRRR